MSKSDPMNAPPRIPDHELLSCIGRGSYGEVWLARNVMGSFRAVKIIDRKRFPMERPFEREFTGIQKFEPISRTHPGLVSILHIGQNRPEGYFYYIMELGDDEETGQNINPEDYVPRTLAREVSAVEKLPLDECVRIGLSLADALGHLHRHGLVHRDVKPGNIIFVHSTPKFADIGLVAEISDNATFVGTEGYVPPEGPGKPSADIYALGKVLYQISLGQPLNNFPELPSQFEMEKDSAQLKKLCQVILKACDLNARKRFQTAQELRDQLSRLFPETLAPRETRPLSPPANPARTAPLQIAILHQPKIEPDESVARLLRNRLTEPDYQ
jgi:eukaryotic-like serine/threonine-protein kinase